jgi:hypothetical protein
VEPWEPFVAAAFAPAAVWLLWRAQTLSVEALRWRLVKLATVRDLKWIYAIVSWLGVVLHEVSHATVLLIGGHGIRQFRAGMESGHVLPARVRRGPFGFLSFLAAALAPLFIPPLLFLVALFLLVPGLDFPFRAFGLGLAEAVAALRHSLVEVPLLILLNLAGLDLATWQGSLVLAIGLLAMPSGRPSHVKGSRFHGTQDEGDVAVVRQQIRRNPVLFVLFLLALYAAYWLLHLTAEGYWYPFEALWAVALAGVALALFGAAWWSLVALGRGTKAWAWWLGPATFVVAQVALRALPAFDTALKVNAASIAAWAVVALLLRFALPRR